MELKGKLDLKWHQTTAFRTAGLALLIALCGYAGGLYSFRQALQGISSMTYDEEISKALGDYMESFKELDSVKRQGILSRLQFATANLQLRALKEEELIDLLKKANISEIASLESLEIDRDVPEEATPHVAWISRTVLEIGPYSVHLPPTQLKQQFDSIQQLKQRYELIQVSWNQEIIPSLLKTNMIIVFSTLILVASIIFLIVRRYSRDLKVLLNGFRFWSENDPTFRIDEPLSKEVGVIASQFNAMADEVELNRRRSVYLEKIASWQTMARKLAHEIKNPLTPIQMMVSQVQRKYKGDDEAYARLLNEAGTIISEEIDALRRMVDSFSRFARLPSPKWGNGDLTLVLRQVFDMEAITYPQHRLIWESDLDSAPLMMDSQLLKQVFLNLIKNAAEANSERQATIRVLLRENPRKYVVEVIDDGAGIAASDLPRVFEAYFTTKHTGPTPGMGLGLAICKKIVMDHQGEMLVESRPGKTCFQIHLPKAGHQAGQGREEQR